jgi:hypothetical protein
MTGEVAAGSLCLDQSIEIHDTARVHLTTVPFTEAVRLIDAQLTIGILTILSSW